MYKYKAEQICARFINIELNGDVIESVVFEGGNYCPGNCQAVPILVKGKTVSEVESLLGGVICGSKSTSCAQQLVAAAKEAYQAK